MAALSAINMLKSLENPVLGTLEPGFPDPSSLRSPEAQLLLGNYYQIRAKTAKKEGSDAQSLSYFRLFRFYRTSIDETSDQLVSGFV